MIVCKRLLYSGRVQGVGFRCTAKELARGWPIAGYVRNLPNGQVELVAEGAAEDVDDFLDAIGHRMGEYIEDQSVDHEQPAGHEDFVIRH